MTGSYSEAAWRLNRTLVPGEEPFRIIPGSPRADMEAKDRVVADLVLGEVKAGHKVLVYCGSHHAFTRYRQPIPFEFLLPARSGRMGNLLHEALGARVAFVQLYSPFAKRWAFFAWSAYRKPFLLPFGGVIDRAQEKLGSPVGFDTSLEPFRSLKDSTSYYALHRSGLTLAGYADGYVVLAPLSERRSVRPFDDLGSEEEMKYLRERWAGTRYERFLEDPVEFRQLVARDGVRPEQAFQLVDRGPALPNVSLSWVLALAAGLVLVGRWIWRRLRRSTNGGCSGA